MPNLIIDNLPIEVPEGTNVIEAAERLGIMIPRFCYLKALGAVGACRMCAVHFVDGPVKGVDMSCMVKAQDEMVVSTRDAEAVDFRRQVIEWLMINHPHDCPVCDEGGQCLLQDETVSGGHAIRRYPGRKRTYRNQYLGEFIQHEMNRCIHCYRCARFYQEYAGYRDFGALQIGNRVYYGRYEEGALENPFSGNLVDICPTGVFTDKPARYTARRWDMQRSPSVCIHCSLGCNTTANGFHQEIIRIEARENEKLNGSFICDRGRFGGFYANHPERPRQPMIDHRAADWQQVMTQAAGRLEKIIAESGPGSVAVLGSCRTSLETMSMLRLFCDHLGFAGPQFFTDQRLQNRTERAIAGVDDSRAISLGAIAQADCIMVIGCDPLNEAPMLALALRQAARKGAVVAVIDPRPVTLPFEFSLFAVPPADIMYLAGLPVHSGLDRQQAGQEGEKILRFYDSLASRMAFAGIDDADINSFAECIAGSKRPAIVCGPGTGPDTLPDFAADLADLLGRIKDKCGLFHVLPGPNAFGAGLFDPAGEAMPFSTMLDGAEQGTLKAIICAEADPFHDFHDRQRLEQALAKAELVICLDYVPSEMARLAHIFCPATTHFESGMGFINNEGRLQFAEPVHSACRPFSQITGGRHPRREFTREEENCLPRPAWFALRELLGRLTGPRDGSGETAVPIPEEGRSLVRQHLKQLGFPDAGERVPGGTEKKYQPLPPGRENREPREAGFELILTEWTYGTEELSSYADPIVRVREEPAAVMHPEDAAEAGLSGGGQVRVHLGKGAIRLPLELSNRMARGCIVLPRHDKIDWQQLEKPLSTTTYCRVEKDEV